MTMSNPWSDFLEEPGAGQRAAYFSHGDKFGGPNRSGRQAKFFQDSFNDLFDQYLGRLGSKVRGGEEPTERWQDYLGGLDWNDEYRRRQSFEQRNQGAGGFVPNVSWRIPGVNA